MKISLFTSASFALLALGSMCASAEGTTQKAVVADTPDKFAARYKELETEMQAGGRYEFISPSDKVRVEADMTSMAAMLDKAGSVDAMKQDDKVRLFNTQEQVNGILTRTDSERLVCEHRAPVGSHIPVTTCKTFGEIEKARRDVQKYGADSQHFGVQCQHGSKAAMACPDPHS